MYLSFFGLSEAPFSITPDPAFVYLSAAHREALAHLLYGVGQGAAGGFVQLTGEVGTGKTTICRCLLEQVPGDTRVALILNPMVTPTELLAAICDELAVPVSGPPESTKSLVDALNDYLLREHGAGNRVVVIIDEAQNLSPEALEQVRLLTNLETAKHKLLQMVLLGQPELRQLLQRQNLRQLAQRITARYHLPPLAPDETAAYVRHRMQVAGAGRNPFTRSALRALHARSGGIPRLINIIADRALAGAYARESEQVSARLVNAAADEVQPSETRVSRRAWPAWLATGAALLAASFMVWGPLNSMREHSEEPRNTGPRITSPETAGPPDEVLRESNSGPTADPVPESGMRGTGSTATAVQDAVGTASTTPLAGSSGPSEMDDRVGESTLALPLDTAWLHRQHDHAFADMAELWRDAGSADVIRAACAGASRGGYACLRDSGSWARLIQLGLPVILVLQDEGARHVVLRGIDGRRVMLGYGADTRLLPRHEVDPLWYGEYLVAWRQPPDWPLQIRRGDSGDAVRIVLQMATLAEPPWQGNQQFDRGFETWLREFQHQHGLTADGIIGPKTMLYLMAPAIEEPTLLTVLEGNS